MEPTVTEWLSRLDQRELSAVELAEHYLGRIALANPVLNAIVAVDIEAVLAQAHEADVRRTRGDSTALLGVPVTVKDCIDVAGLPCQSGTKLERRIPSRDAVVVDRMRRAGAVILAKTNLPELSSSYETDNVQYGRTNNPIDLDRTPGGSSGGEGAVLGADVSPIGVGSDGGGSIRVPCHYCGVLGLRPTVGRVPSTGTWPSTRASASADLSCIGPMGRSTHDVALLLEVIHGPDLIDPFAHPVALRRWQDVDVSRLRVGWYVDDGLARATAATGETVENAARILEKRGAGVSQVRPPLVEEATELFFRTISADGGEAVRRLVGDSPSDHTQQFLSLLTNPPHGSSRSAAEYFMLVDRIHTFRSRVRRWMDDFDVILAPVSPSPAPLHGTPPTGVLAENYGRYEGFNFTHTYSIAGLPAGSVPAGVADGLPIGVQVISQCWREDLVLAVMAHLEQEFGGFEIVDRAAW